MKKKKIKNNSKREDDIRKNNKRYGNNNEKLKEKSDTSTKVVSIIGFKLKDENLDNSLFAIRNNGFKYEENKLDEKNDIKNNSENEKDNINSNEIDNNNESENNNENDKNSIPKKNSIFINDYNNICVNLDNNASYDEQDIKKVELKKTFYPGDLTNLQNNNQKIKNNHASEEDKLEQERNKYKIIKNMKSHRNKEKNSLEGSTDEIISRELIRIHNLDNEKNKKKINKIYDLSQFEKPQNINNRLINFNIYSNGNQPDYNSDNAERNRKMKNSSTEGNNKFKKKHKFKKQKYEIRENN